MKTLAYSMAFLFLPSFLLHHFSVIDMFGGLLVVGMSAIVVVAFYVSVEKPEKYPPGDEDK